MPSKDSRAGRPMKRICFIGNAKVRECEKSPKRKKVSFLGGKG